VLRGQNIVFLAWIYVDSFCLTIYYFRRVHL